LFGRKKEKNEENDEMVDTGEELVLREKSPRTVREGETFDIGDYIIIGIAFLLLLSLVFLFYSVIPEIGWRIYYTTIEYLTKPMSWMPLYWGIVIFIILFLLVDHIKPIVYFKNQHKWYRGIYESNGLIHFRLIRPWGAELIVHERRVAGRDARKYIINSDLDIVYAGKNIHVEGTDVFEVTKIRDMEERLNLKDKQIAILQRQLASLTGRMMYWEKEMVKARQQTKEGER